VTDDAVLADEPPGVEQARQQQRRAGVEHEVGVPDGY
jgi:hypothetical protein